VIGAELALVPGMAPYHLGFLFIAGAMTTLGAASPSGVTLSEMPGHITEGTVTIDAPPAEVYRVVTDYSRWPWVLTDTSGVRVESGGPNAARVRFRSQAIGYVVTVEFENIPGRAIRFHLVEGPPGGRARGDYRLDPIDGGRRTRVTAQLYLDVVGAAGIFVSGSSIRRKREAKVERDLTDISHWFAARNRSAAAAPAPAP
jgi:uncharacterized membrane protein